MEEVEEPKRIVRMVGSPCQEAIMSPTIESSRITPSHVDEEKCYPCVSGAESLFSSHLSL